MGYGGCKQRIKGIDKCFYTLKVLYIIRNN